MPSTSARTYRCVHVVDPHSADPGIAGCIPRRAESTDHFSTCKPAAANDPLYVTVARIVEGVRDRARAGIDHPVFRTKIRETLQDTEFAAYADVGRFAEIPAADDVRRRIEQMLREQFRERFDVNPVTAAMERALQKSRYDIDKYLLSLWLERKVADELNILVTFIHQAETSLRAAIGGPEPPTAILRIEPHGHSTG